MLLLADGNDGLVGTLAVLRTYQSRHAGRLLRDEYLGADREAIDTAVAPTASAGRVLVAARGLWRPRAKTEPLDTVYLVAEFSGDRCDAIQIPADASQISFWIKGISAGTGSASITNATYTSYSNTVTVSP